ncbi:DUF3558 domain-containing protein [Kibdelosporangium philippinense]
MVGVGVVTAVASGCTNTQPGTPSATADATGQTSSETTPSSTNDYGAPRVTSPLDGTPFLTKPCAVLTVTQLQPLNVPASGKPDTDSPLARSSGPGCTWSNVDTGTGIGFGFLSGNKNGLSDTYRGRDRFKGYFEPTNVEGYPAVFNDPSDFRAKGSCNITVGISDTLTFRVSWDEGRAGLTSCDRAKQVASMVIQTIRSGG